MLSLASFGDRLVECLPRLMRELSRHERNHLTRGDITLPQFRALDHLARYGGC